MEAIIYKAIEGGWGGFRDNSEGIAEFVEFYSDRYHFAYATQQASFWKALGRALKWKDKNYISEFSTKENHGKIIRKIPGWKIQWHRYIDHLEDGRYSLFFFNYLLI